MFLYWSLASGNDLLKEAGASISTFQLKEMIRCPQRLVEDESEPNSPLRLTQGDAAPLQIVKCRTKTTKYINFRRPTAAAVDGGEIRRHVVHKSFTSPSCPCPGLFRSLLNLYIIESASPYSSTMNLPKTDFSMRANAKQREPELMRIQHDSYAQPLRTPFSLFIL